MRPLRRARTAVAIVVLTALVPAYGQSRDAAVSVSAAPNGAARITLSDGRSITVPKEPGQVGVAAGRIGPSGRVGWFAEFRVDGVSYPIALTLVIWRAGRIVWRFHAEQSFYSWAFYARGAQIAYHDGPLHGERRSHCELRDVATGVRIAVWDGDLNAAGGRPAWVGGLTR